MKKFLLLLLCIPFLLGAGHGVDKATLATTTITYEHHEVHAGSSFTVHYDNTTSSDDDHRTAIAFTTANTASWMHATVSILASSPAEFFIYEAATGIDDDDGSFATAINRNRNSSNTSGILSIDNPAVANTVTTYTESELTDATVATTGTTITHFTLAGGEGPREVGGSTRGAQEWILKQNTVYLLVMQNIGANANIHEIQLDWYEHQDKEPL